MALTCIDTFASDLHSTRDVLSTISARSHSKGLPFSVSSSIDENEDRPPVVKDTITDDMIRAAHI